MIGINFRGAAFAFRHFGRQTGEKIPFMSGTFAAAMFPYLLIGQLPLVEAAAPPATLRAFFLVLVIGAIILAPSLFPLYRTFRGEPNPELPP